MVISQNFIPLLISRKFSILFQYGKVSFIIQVDFYCNSGEFARGKLPPGRVENCGKSTPIQMAASNPEDFARKEVQQ